MSKTYRGLQKKMSALVILASWTVGTGFYILKDKGYNIYAMYTFLIRQGLGKPISTINGVLFKRFNAATNYSKHYSLGKKKLGDAVMGNL